MLVILHSAFHSFIVRLVHLQTLVTLDEAHGDDEEMEEDKMEAEEEVKKEVEDTTVPSDSMGK